MFRQASSDASSAARDENFGEVVVGHDASAGDGDGEA